MEAIPLLDDIGKLILSELGKNGRVSSLEITRVAQNMGYDITDRGIRHRMERLEKSHTILGYSTLLNPELVSEKVNRTILIKFKYSRNASVLMDRLNNYIQKVPFCVYSARLRGDFDWICHFVFESLEQYELESNDFLHGFADLIADYRSYESKTIKVSPYSVFDEHGLREQKHRVYQILNSIKRYDSLNEKLQEIVESLVKYFGAKCAHIWFVDKERQYLILKFSAGKYKDIQGEFSKVPIDSLKIGPIVKTKKPAITTDVVNDTRIRYQEWAKSEKLKSYSGYPLIHRGEAIGVLAMFSEKKPSPADFEILGVFCNHLSKELSSLFTAAEYLVAR